MLAVAWIPVAGAMAFVADDEQRYGERIVAAVFHQRPPPYRTWRGVRPPSTRLSPPPFERPASIMAVRLAPSTWVPSAHGARYCSVVH